MWKTTAWSDAKNVVAQRKQVLDCLKSLLQEYCKIHPSFDAFDAYSKLKTKCEVVGELTADMVVKLWSHPGLTELGDRELCSVLGEVIRDDDARTPVEERPSVLFKSAVTLVCMLQVHLNSARRFGMNAPKHWPKGPGGIGDGKSDKKNTTWRGGGLPEVHIPFYQALSKSCGCFRVPAPLPTSFERATALKFKDRARSKGFAGVLWEVSLKDPALDASEGGGGCLQVNYLEKSLIDSEREFLFSAYSAFRVLAVDTSNPFFAKINLEACRDNKDAPEDVPSAPWI